MKHVLLAFCLLVINLWFTWYATTSDKRFYEGIKIVYDLIQKHGWKAAVGIVLADLGLIVAVILILGLLTTPILSVLLIYAYCGYIAGIIKGDYARYKINKAG